MTNEQRVRVDRLERYLITDRGKTYTTVRVNDLDTVLFLIKENQNTIESLKEKLILENKAKNKAEEECKRLWYISSSTCCYDMQKKLSKKNKQIDLMADFMYKTGTGRRTLSCMFRQNDECNENGCRYCIKQYFENKVNSEKEK